MKASLTYQTPPPSPTSHFSLFTALVT
uniref:Uncharacterized protein n=1 Tax=Anguilla anguilla TaxID=7936 RepID=A0A0E9VBV2_ANGAN